MDTVYGAWSRWFRKSSWQADRRFRSYLQYSTDEDDNYFWVDYKVYIMLSGSHGLTTDPVPVTLTATGLETRTAKRAFKYEKGVTLLVTEGQYKWDKSDHEQSVTLQSEAKWIDNAKYVNTPKVSSYGFKSIVLVNFTVPIASQYLDDTNPEEITNQWAAIVEFPEYVVRGEKLTLVVKAPPAVEESLLISGDCALVCTALGLNEGFVLKSGLNETVEVYVPLNAPNVLEVTVITEYVGEDFDSIRTISIPVRNPVDSDISSQLEAVYIDSDGNLVINTTRNNLLEVFFGVDDAYVLLEKINNTHYILPDAWSNPVRLKIFFLIQGSNTIEEIGFYKGELKERIYNND